MRNIKSILLNLTSKHVLLMLWWCVVSWVVFSPPHPTPHHPLAVSCVALEPVLLNTLHALCYI